MWTSPEPAAPAASGHGFRRRSLWTMMLVVAAVTAAAIGVAEPHARSVVQHELEERFGEQTTALLALRATRLAAISDKCRAISRSVRIRAALEEADVDDLYRNALDELRDALAPAGGDLPAAESGPLPRANFAGFLDAAGAILAPPDPARAGGPLAIAGLNACAQRLAAVGRLERQEIGYLLLGTGTFDEVVATPIVDPTTGDRLGALVLGFPPEGLAGGGIWLGGNHVHGLDHVDGINEAALTAGLQTAAGRGTDRFRLDVAGEPALVFFRALDVGGLFPPAHGVCLYPLTNSLSEQRALHWRIVAGGALALAAGFGLSWRLSHSLSKPVERLAVTGAQNLAGRRLAEAELLAANAQLERTLAELRATQSRVIQQERLRALGEMASGIAHDFNNALMPILGFSELLLHVPGVLDDRNKTINYLKTINRSARDAGHVVRRLREFYRPREEGEALLPVDLAGLAGGLSDPLRPKWHDQALANGANVEWRNEFAPGVPPVAGNEADLREALTNLVFNAVDAMPGGGTLTLRVRRGEDGQTGIVEVSDTGMGMSEEVRRRCLEPFFSTKGERGTGLGLAMVFGIVQRHHGTVEIDSQPGRGTTFRLCLPLHAAETAVASEPAADVRPATVRGRRVLVVDDEPPVRDLLVHYLEAEGHRPTVAASAREGLERFGPGGRFDVVITDMAMPGMSGEQLAGLIKGLEPAVPVVLLTGFGAFLDPSARASGVDVVASKPITLQGLRDCLRVALDEVPAK